MQNRSTAIEQTDDNSICSRTSYDNLPNDAILNIGYCLKSISTLSLFSMANHRNRIAIDKCDRNHKLNPWLNFFKKHFSHVEPEKYFTAKEDYKFTFRREYYYGDGDQFTRIKQGDLVTFMSINDHLTRFMLDVQRYSPLCWAIVMEYDHIIKYLKGNNMEVVFNETKLLFAYKNKHYAIIKEMFSSKYPFLSNPIDGVINIYKNNFENILYNLKFLFNPNGEYLFDTVVHTINLSGFSLSIPEVIDEVHFVVHEERLNCLCDFIKSNPLIHTIKLNDIDIDVNEAKKILDALKNNTNLISIEFDDRNTIDIRHEINDLLKINLSKIKLNRLISTL